MPTEISKPSQSRAQHRFWEAAEHDPKFRRRQGVSQETAQEFTEADRHNKKWKKKERVGKADEAMTPEIQELLKR